MLEMQAEEVILHGKPISRVGAFIIIVIWLMVFAGVIWSIIRMFRK